jgi:hypothetical protein
MAFMVIVWSACHPMASMAKRCDPTYTVDCSLIASTCESHTGMPSSTFIYASATP